MGCDKTWRRCVAAVAAATVTATARATAAAADAGADALADLEALLGTQVQGASRQVENALDAPAVVSTLERQESQALGHRTVADMLQRLPGIQLGTDRGYGRVGLRGVSRPGDYNSRLLMSIDGYRVNDALWDQALPGYEFPIVADWVKRLELVSGPASSIYGSNALLGVVNAVTVDGADLPGARLRAGLGTQATRDAVLSWGGRDDRGDLFVGLALHGSAGQAVQDAALVSPAAPDGRVGFDDTRYRSLFVKWHRGPWRLSLVSQQRDKDVPIAPYGTVVGLPVNYRDRYDYAEAAWDGPWQGDWRASARASLSRSGFKGRYASGDAAQPLFNRDDVHAHWAGAQAQWQWRGWINHQLTVGLDARQVLGALQRNFDEAPAATYLDRRDRLSQGALYLQDQWRLAERWALTGGLRADRVQGFRTALSPRLALVMRPDEHQAVKLLFGRGFRVPNLSERFYDDAGASQVANPGLQPERIRSLALAWERVSARGRLAATLYRDRLTGLIDLVTPDEELARYVNRSGVRSRGLELDATWLPGAGWQLRASVSLQDTRDERGRLDDAPRWLAKGHALAPLAPQWSSGLQWQAQGRRSALLPTQASADAVLRWQPEPARSLTLSVRNLTDAAWWDPATGGTPLARVPWEGRRLMLDWRQAF